MKKTLIKTLKYIATTIVAVLAVVFLVLEVG
jgi:hypothetical protein